MSWPAAWAARRRRKRLSVGAESDAPHFGTRSGEIGILAYKAEALPSEAGGPDALTAVSEGRRAGQRLPQALGIRLARNAGANFTRCCVRRGPST